MQITIHRTNWKANAHKKTPWASPLWGRMLSPDTSPSTLGIQQMGGMGVPESIIHVLCTFPLSHIIHFLFSDKNKSTWKFYLFLTLNNNTVGHKLLQIIIQVLNTMPHV